MFVVEFFNPVLRDTVRTECAERALAVRQVEHYERKYHAFVGYRRAVITPAIEGAAA